MNQLSIFSGKQLKECGMQLALQSTPDEWKERVINELEQYARKNKTFTAEEFRAFWLSKGGEQPHSSNVWGAMFGRAAKLGLIKKTGKYQPAVSPKTHGHPIAVWSSLVHKSTPIKLRIVGEAK